MNLIDSASAKVINLSNELICAVTLLLSQQKNEEWCLGRDFGRVSLIAEWHDLRIPGSAGRFYVA